MVRKILGLSVGVLAFCLMTLLPATTWAQAVDITFANSIRNRVFVVRGADGVIYYTVQNVSPTAAVAFISSLTGTNASCTGNPFALALDANSNRFPDSNAGATPFHVVPPGASAASDPVVSRVATPNTTGVANLETGALITVRGNDAKMYRTVLDQGCDGSFAEGSPFDFSALGFGDSNRDGWPGSSSTVSPWSALAN